MLPPSFIAAVAARLGDGFLVDDPELLQRYGRDWTRVFVPRPAALARPADTKQVSTFLALCHAHRVPIVPSGGRTGLSAGAVAASGEIVLSLERLNSLGAVDLLGSTLRVGAGAITEAVHQHCAASGLTWPVDFAAKGSSQIGGNVATNAGGTKVVRYGSTRSWVLGLEVVLADGTILAGDRALEKNNSGPDLRQLFIGSEGILGVVTAATLKLTRLPQETTVLFLGLQDLARVLTLFASSRAAQLELMAYEVLTEACLLRLLRHRSQPRPLGTAHPYYVLMEVERVATVALETWLAAACAEGTVDDGVVATTLGQQRQLWALREGISESLSATGFPHKYDIALPLAGLAAFCADLGAAMAAAYPGYELCSFGHIGDGNLHLNIMQPEEMARADFLSAAGVANASIYALVQRHGGTVSAEHGIGLLKLPYLKYCRTPAEIATMRVLKTALDPRGILNPGKVLPALSPTAEAG